MAGLLLTRPIIGRLHCRGGVYLRVVWMPTLPRPITGRPHCRVDLSCYLIGDWQLARPISVGSIAAGSPSPTCPSSPTCPADLSPALCRRTVGPVCMTPVTCRPADPGRLHCSAFSTRYAACAISAHPADYWPPPLQARLVNPVARGPDLPAGSIAERSWPRLRRHPDLRPAVTGGLCFKAGLHQSGDHQSDRVARPSTAGSIAAPPASQPSPRRRPLAGPILIGSIAATVCCGCGGWADARPAVHQLARLQHFDNPAELLTAAGLARPTTGRLHCSARIWSLVSGSQPSPGRSPAGFIAAS